MAAKQKKFEAVELLHAVEVEMVVSKAGEETRSKIVRYSDGLQMKKIFLKKGYRVVFYQLGVYQGPGAISKQ